MGHGSKPWPAHAVALIALVGGMAAGALAKFADGSGIPGVGMIGSYFGVWVAACAMIAARSSTWVRAIIATLGFLLGMVAAYYAVQGYLFGFLSPALLLGWSAAALVAAPPFAALVWRARGQGWPAALGAALPIGLLAQEAYSLRWRLGLNADYQALFVFDMGCALLLLLLLARGRDQRLRALALMPLVAVVAHIGFTAALPAVLGALRRG